MIVDTVNSPGTLAQQQMKPVDMVETQRKGKDSMVSAPDTSSEAPKVQPEELLDRINELTQGGLYSVRFERSTESSDLIVKLFDNKTQEVIRQIPAEELLNFKATFAELIGNLVNTQG